MKYANLQELIGTSSSSRCYFLSLPVNVQMKLHARSDFIHSLHELRLNAENIMKYYR